MEEAKVQLNLTFLPIEDRILFRIASGTPGSMEEHRLLLTRRFVKLLWNALHCFVEEYTLDPRIPPEGKNTVMQFQQDAALSQADFATPYTSEKVIAPLGSSPLLLHKFQARKGANNSCVLFLEATSGQTIKITLSLQLIHSLRKMLADMVKEAEWNLTCAVLAEDALSVADPLKSLH